VQATFSVIRNAAGEALPVATGRPGEACSSSSTPPQLARRPAAHPRRGAAARGFGIDSAQAFEAAARAVEPELKNEYLGTSPRDALTPYVFSASELPPYYPIPQHNEMSFLKRPAAAADVRVPGRGAARRRDAAGGHAGGRGGARPGGARAVRARGIRIIRNYGGPSGAGRFDLWQLKRWDEVFQTTDRAVVEAKCAAEKVYTDVRWGPGDRLRLVSEHEALRDHPETARPCGSTIAGVPPVVGALGAGARVQ
jgi:hypothetical protein